jgi:hypothetical protein
VRGLGHKKTNKQTNKKQASGYDLSRIGKPPDAEHSTLVTARCWGEPWERGDPSDGDRVFFGDDENVAVRQREACMYEMLPNHTLYGNF